MVPTGPPQYIVTKSNGYVIMSWCSFINQILCVLCMLWALPKNRIITTSVVSITTQYIKYSEYTQLLTCGVLC